MKTHQTKHIYNFDLLKINESVFYPASEERKVRCAAHFAGVRNNMRFKCNKIVKDGQIVISVMRVRK